MVQLDELTIKQKLLIPSVIVIVGFLAVALVYQYQLSLQEQAESEAQSVTDFNNTANKLYESILHAIINEKDFLLHSDSDYSEQLSSSVADVDDLADTLENMAPNKVLQTQVKQLRSHFDNYSANMKHVQDAITKLKLDKTVAGEKQLEEEIAQSEKEIAGVESEMKRLVEVSASLMEDSHKQFKRKMTQIRIIFNSTLFIIGMMAVFVLFRLSRGITGSLEKLIVRMRDVAEGSGDLTRRLDIPGTDETATLAGLVNSMMDNLSSLIGKVQESGIQVASSVTEIAASTREQEATATEHASTTNEVASSVKEISATSKQLGQTTEEVNALAQGTSATASDAQVLLTRLDSTMSRMAKASNRIADKLAALNEKTSNIGDMVTTINKVADQTNLLSLNAAIEAEKAGEYGRGFAVVATQIRRLADQTAIATYDIEQMVGEVRSAISAGVMGMDKFSEEIHSSVEEAKIAGLQMEKTIEQVQSLAPHIESVNEGLQAQIEGASMIDEAMMNLSEAALQTAEFIRQSNNAIAELNNAARNLQEGAAIFKIKS